MTETCGASLISLPNEHRGLIPNGMVSVKIVDPDDFTKELGYDTVGELCVSSDTVMRGYYKNEEETQEVIFEEDGVRWLRTRDLATISPEGTIKITGRIKRIYYRLTSDRVAVRVYPMRIEEALFKEGSVRDAAVVGIKDDVMAYRTIAFLIVKDASEDRNEIKERLDTYCVANLPDNHMPDEYIFVDEFPITRAGKVDYKKLEEMAEKQ